ncbi:MAG: hypothetical protein HOW73_26130 [Polyangiaceae bacterium]|nr:hypothetical protein [Polyangiaceae bacterium]
MRRLLGPLAFILVTASGCSLINKPDDVNPGNGGSGGAGGGQGGTGATGGAPPACTTNEECASLTTDCTVGECGPEGTCIATNTAADTPCGGAPTGTCDLQNTCDGNGACVENRAPNGTFCADCPAGPGQCGPCMEGVCGDCAGAPATTKTFRSPLSTSGWVLTGDWRVYADAPPPAAYPISQCNDGIDNDGDGLTDYDDDPGCSSATDIYEVDAPGTECSDGVDNDADGVFDYPADPKCESAADDAEVTLTGTHFAHRVLGTDGNRRYPYGLENSREFEASSATSPPTILPEFLTFLSWHVDEGDAYDLKAVEVSTDGVSFQTVAVCLQGGGAPYAFCPPSFGRAADAWDSISLPVPAGLVGQVGYVRFSYNTNDAYGTTEQGWYVDALNFAQDCACAADNECGYLASSCATGSCDTAVGECVPAAQNVDSACDLDVAEECGAPACDDSGWCVANSRPFEGQACASCPEGAEFCDGCMGGTCASCVSKQNFLFPDLTNWTFSGGWGLFDAAPPNSVTPNESLFFPPQHPQLWEEEPMVAPFHAPMLGNDGTRTGAFPYAGESEIVDGTVTTAPTIIPAELRFNSWHQDRGGGDAFTPGDKKTIRVYVDGVATTLLSCDTDETTPFCVAWPAGTNRAAEDWDEIVIEIPDELVGQIGTFEFSYKSDNAGTGWERGWYIDDININGCDQAHPPWLIPQNY